MCLNALTGINRILTALRWAEENARRLCLNALTGINRILTSAQPLLKGEINNVSQCPYGH